ncbi:MAG: histidine triad nucleotide-binding protein [Gemmataceae bacterium]
MMTDNIFKKIADKVIRRRSCPPPTRTTAASPSRHQSAGAPSTSSSSRRQVIATHADITEADRDLLGHLHVVAVKLANDLELHRGLPHRRQLQGRGGPDRAASALHLLGGRSFTWPPG